jgi:hypothetical protein
MINTKDIHTTLHVSIIKRASSICNVITYLVFFDVVFAIRIAATPHSDFRSEEYSVEPGPLGIAIKKKFQISSY